MKNKKVSKKVQNFSGRDLIQQKMEVKRLQSFNSNGV